MTDYEGFKQLEVIRISELTRATDNNTILVISAYMLSLDTEYVNMLNEFTRKILCEWDYNDYIMMDLLTAITLFNPNRPNIVHRHNVRLEQQLYIYLLQRYLLFKYGSESESKLQKLMFSLQMLQMLSNIELVVVMKNFKPFTDSMGPLMKEIYPVNNN
ncbi:unnamed protein product [Oppiella nova]|uniref:NR LBD domain-containing protein n=1 Tax=Oppiella nova TaxID=334625 RepID=A0A7R9QEH8_9ACAR|nr:unnamed protein product [Oppiella nova]CAG2164196.1 unnamed protein product [Oppiella nova]